MPTPLLLPSGIQADLAVIGIQTEIVEEEVGTWFDNLMAGNMDFSIAAMGTDMVGTEDMLSIYNPNGGYPPACLR